jgi:hypothetical protein
MIGCWVKENQLDDRPCDGQLVRAHLIPKQRTKKQFQRAGGAWHKFNDKNHAFWVPLDELLWAPASYRWVCGGPMGQGGHHGRIDGRQIRVPRSVIPVETEEWAERFGLAWSLDHDYGAKT